MNPKARWPWISLSHAYRARGDPEGAIDSLEKAMTVDSAGGWAFLFLGEAYAAGRNHIKVIECYERAVAVDPTEWWAWQYLTDAYIANGDVAGAIQAYQRAVEQNPGQEWALGALRNALMRYAVQQDHVRISSEGLDSMDLDEQQHPIEPPLSPAIFNRLSYSLTRNRDMSHHSEKQEDWFVIYNKNTSHKFTVSLVHTLEHSSWVSSVAFSSTGEHLATGSYRSVQVFDINSGSKIGRP